ncbi:hypothetical protein BU23DRAFT_545768 [Bimuria novae-zelandiae CBS 107.79]|uniref:Rhodopsin domain-containing protein n=1 Tax=Bimuria novae-zelandiae CBS 107.79 TaxID=1447943 RepID=A0A6A5UKY1_9PLEO|nr:hypothetical protein BU23DRAFT_545768 [Bimuria novae-zelandiae CBS 107.79]
MTATPPPYFITEVDKQGLIAVSTAITLAFVWTCFGIRIWLRCRSVESWKLDDNFLAGATILSTAQSAVVFNAINAGLGKSIGFLSSSTLKEVGKNELAAQILYLSSLFLSKCAVLFLYLRLSPQKRHIYVTWTTIAISVAWLLASVVLVALPCSALDFWFKGGAKCSYLWLRWKAIGAIDIATETVIVLISVLMVAHINMRLKGKIVVIVAFSARLPVIAAAAFRLRYLHTTIESADRTLDGSYYAIATQWHVGYAIMSTTISGLRPFLRPFSKSGCHYSSSNGNSLPSRSGVEPQGQAYQLEALPGDHPSTSGTHEHLHLQAPIPVLRPDASTRNVVITGGETGWDDDMHLEEDATSRVSRESQQWIIKKRTELRVENTRLSDVSRTKSSRGHTIQRESRRAGQT